METNKTKPSPQPSPACGGGGATWPAQYTEADVALIGRIQMWMEEREYTQAALARLSRLSASSLNQIIKGVYAAPPGQAAGLGGVGHAPRR